MEIKWFGIDCGSADHPMNTTIRLMRPDIARQFEERVGMTCEEFFPRYEYTHKLSGRRWSTTCSRSTTSPSRKACSTPRTSAATSSRC